MKKINVSVVFGTRPEIIKLAPIISDLSNESSINLNSVYVTQHGTVVNEVLHLFGIRRYSTCEIERDKDSLSDFSAKLISSLEEYINAENTDILIVQGDTTTAFCAAYVAFLNQIQIYHIEAGLRTHDNLNPFPEEINRRLISVMANYHFAPTLNAKQNLLKEGISENKIKVIGNTVVDAALRIREMNTINLFSDLETFLEKFPRFILITCHRRENWKNGIDMLMEGISNFANLKKEIGIIFVTHLNPKLQNKVIKKFNKFLNILVLPPLNYGQFQKVLSLSEFVVTDSGGIQEEAPVYGKFAFVARTTTERTESQEHGFSKILKEKPEEINLQLQGKVNEVSATNLNAKLIYGDGQSSKRVIDFIKNKYCDEII